MTPPPVFGKVYMASQLTDAFARKFYYLRLSITDVCNFRCTYCLPDGYKPGGVTNNGFLTVDEFVALRALLPVLARRRCVLPAASLHYAAILPTSLPP